MVHEKSRVKTGAEISCGIIECGPEQAIHWSNLCDEICI